MKTTIQVLIIDDEIEICYLLTKMLKNKGIDSTFVYTLSEAKKILRTTFPTLIFLDNQLPDGLGMDFLQYIMCKYPKSKVTIITGHESVSDMEKAISNGAIDYISKPFTWEKINTIIEKVKFDSFFQ